MNNFTNNFAFDRLSDSARQGIKEAICSCGMRTGLLKLQAPAHHTLGYPAWMAIMGELNSQRVSIYGLMEMNEHQKEVFIEVGKYAETMHICVNTTLQHPFEFNTYHYQDIIEDVDPMALKSIIVPKCKQLPLFPDV